LEDKENAEHAEGRSFFRVFRVLFSSVTETCLYASVGLVRPEV
jgi:hypothetical protein